MKIKRFFAFALTLAIVLCAVVIPASATEENTHQHTEIIILDENVSKETEEKILAYFANGADEGKDDAATYGLTCTLFGHKIETYAISSVVHKYRDTAPRCQEKTYNYEICTRCDYETSTLVLTRYIYCC